MHDASYCCKCRVPLFCGAAVALVERNMPRLIENVFLVQLQDYHTTMIAAKSAKALLEEHERYELHFAQQCSHHFSRPEG